MNNQVNFVVEIKNNGKWEQTKTEQFSAEVVYQSLANDLIAKKLNNCTYIKSIKRTQLYNGFERITVTYDNDVRRIYTIESH